MAEALLWPFTMCQRSVVNDLAANFTYSFNLHELAFKSLIIYVGFSPFWDAFFVKIL